MTANKGYGLSKSNSYIVLGGEVNRWMENFHGELKDVKFFDKLVITPDQFKCYSD